MNERQQNNTNAVVKLAAERAANGDPGGQDQFDGGCPADVLSAQIVKPDAGVKLSYGILTVWSDGTHDITSVSAFDIAATLKKEWDAKYQRANHHIISVVVPEFRTVLP